MMRKLGFLGLLATGVALLPLPCAVGAESAAGADLQIAVGEQENRGTVTLAAPALRPGERMLLDCDARLLSGTPGGWAVGAVELELNGQVLGPRDFAGRPRLRERGTHFDISVKPGRIPWWGRQSSADKPVALTLFYASENATELDRRVVSEADRAAGTHYRFDVTDLVKPGAENRLEAVLKLKASSFRGALPELRLRDIRLAAEARPKRQAGRIGKMDYPAVLPEDLQLTLPSAPQPTAAVLEFPALKLKSDQVAVLAFNVRIATPVPSGWNPYLQVMLNGKPLDRMTADGHYRLLRRPEVLQTTHEREKTLNMWHRRGQPTLLNFFGPLDSEELDRRIVSGREESYNYYLEITDLASLHTVGADNRIENDKLNRLEFKYLLTSADGKGPVMVIQDINILLVPRADLRKLGGITATEFHSGREAAALTLGDARLQINESGAMELIQNGERIFIDSYFSYPAAPAMKFNAMTAAQASGESGWRPEIRRIDAKTVEISARAGNYVLRRTVTAAGECFRVVDQIANTSGADLGIAVRNTVGVNAEQFRENRIAGATDTVRSEGQSASNPTLFIRGCRSSAGVVAEDTVSRAQLVLTAQSNLLCMGTEGCGIAAGRSATREWSIYPNGDGDYYAFINRLRRAWKVNYTVPGPFWFREKVPPTLDAGVVCVGPWLDYVNHHNEDGVDHERYCAQMMPQLAALRAGSPGLRILARLETNLVAFDCRKVPWGGDLVQRTGKRNSPEALYGGFMSVDATRKFDASGHPMRDSVIRNASGQAMYDNYYPEKPYVNLMVQPETGNSRYRLFLEQFELTLNRLGCDGVYIDQFQPCAIGGVSDNRWDGHTVTLNADGSIASKRYNYAITGAPARAELVERVVGRGKLVVVNGQAMSREEQSAGRIAFQEMENDRADVTAFLHTKPPISPAQTMSHLGTPIALGLRAYRYCPPGTVPDRRAEIINKGVIWALRNGLLCYYYEDYAGNMPFEGENAGSFAPGNHMFPFTPVGLHEGWLEGVERTIAAISGRYTLKGARPPRLYHFNCRGIPYEKAAFAVAGGPGAWTVDVKLDDWNEIAVLEVQD